MPQLTRATLTRVGLLLLTLLALDGAFTWYVTDQAAATVMEIELRDGFVDVAESPTGTMHRIEIEIASGDNGDRIGRARLLWLPAVALCLLAGLLLERADEPLQRSLVMLIAITLAVWAAPRVIYSSELGVLDAIYG